MLPTIARFREAGFYAHRRGGDADLHQPEQRLDRHRRAAVGARHLRQFHARPRDRREIMMTDPELMRSDTILALMSHAGVATAAVTAKDKLRRMLGLAGWRASAFRRNGRCCTWPRTASTRSRRWSGAAEARHVFGRSVAVRARCRHPPGRAGPRAAALSVAVGLRAARPCAGRGRRRSTSTARSTRGSARLAELGCVVGVTADHGMNDKALPDGEPHVIFLEDVLNAQFGAGAVRVICPITDPFVRHHGALGSFVRVYRKNGAPLGGVGGGAARVARHRPGARPRRGRRRFELPLRSRGRPRRHRRRATP